MPRRLAAAACLLLAAGPRARAGSDRLLSAWRIRSSAEVAETGERVSQAGYDASRWHAVTVPNTVVGALVESGHFPDPYFAMNLRQIPGTSYPIGQRFTLLPTPADSPFKPSWWYRTEFEIPIALLGRSLALRFEGINYRANVWMNGTRLATQDAIAGAFRRYELDVGAVARPGERNAVAVEVFGPEPHDLAFMWVDWNPTPADKNMGLWGEVALVDSGPIALRNPHVMTQVDLSSLDSARLTITVEARNTTDRPVSGVVRGAIEAVQFSRRIELGPREAALVRFTPQDVPQLEMAEPRLWWPYRMGAQNLYTLALDSDVAGDLSDRQTVRFGIVQYDSELTKEGHRLFKVNGKPILIRGGGWASDMLLRPASRERLEAELRYTREMGLNTIRLEGKLESDLFYELADRYGILVMPGFCCCDQWEQWDKWDAEDHRVGPASLRDQILRIRNHPSVFVWLNGSDFPPVARVEQAYLEVLKSLEWPKPILSNATDAPGPVSGPSGVKMRGPYDYVAPSYWLLDKKRGGAFGFATEVGPGAAVPPLESLKAMLPEESLWPMGDAWRFHAGGDEFKDIRLFTDALEARYGKAQGVEDYARKAQALAYEGQRAMFEAFGRNKYTATGVIQWMLNNAWPSMIWHLYDWYLRPGGGYFGSKKACEPLHVQFSYDDRSVAVVNDLPDGFRGLKVKAKLYDATLAERFSQEARLDVGADSVARAFAIPRPPGLTKLYFLRLDLEDAQARPRSSNFYWLSTQEDVVDLANTKFWWYTPTKVHADLKALAGLPPTRLAVRASFEESGREWLGRVVVENTGAALAFQAHLEARDPTSGREILPVYWEDNYFALLPGEKRELSVALPRRSATADDDRYRFAAGRSEELGVVLSADAGSARFDWPRPAASDWDTALVGVRVDAGAEAAPWLELLAGTGGVRQYFEAGARGLRWLNLTGLRTQLSPGAAVAIATHGLALEAGPATVRLFANRLDWRKKLLILATHPDDAEIAAFGLYAGSNASIVTVTSGNAGDANYRDNFPDPAEHYLFKGFIRAVDSVTVPWQGGIPPERCFNLGYFDARLATMYGKPTEVVPELYGPNDDVAPYRRANVSRLLSNGPRKNTWVHLVEDLVAVLEKVKPGIVVMPYPQLDTHPDHQFASVAAVEALERWKGDARFLLYTNHAFQNLYPFGPPGATMSLPPWSGPELAVEGVFAKSVSPELQRRKLFALESMHDLRLSPTEQDGCLPPGTPPQRDDYPRVPAVDYLRRGPRSEELFFVFGRDGVRELIRSFLAARQDG